MFQARELWRKSFWPLKIDVNNSINFKKYKSRFKERKTYELENEEWTVKLITPWESQQVTSAISNGGEIACREFGDFSYLRT